MISFRSTTGAPKTAAQKVVPYLWKIRIEQTLPVSVNYWFIRVKANFVISGLAVQIRPWAPKKKMGKPNHWFAHSNLRCSLDEMKKGYFQFFNDIR